MLVHVMAEYLVSAQATFSFIRKNEFVTLSGEDIVLAEPMKAKPRSIHSSWS